jgi:hypothetical protein
VPRRASSWYPPAGFGSRGQIELPLSGPVSATLLTDGTMRQTSTNVSFDTALVTVRMTN